MGWSERQHRRSANRCPVRPCVPEPLASVGSAWSVHDEDPVNAMITWLNRFCADLARTHAESLAERVAVHIESRLEQRLNMPDLEHRFGADEASIRRAFQREFRMSPQHWHILARIRRVETMLKIDPTAKIEPLARAVGWRSKKDLYRAVRAIRGCTPGALRTR